MRRFESAAAAGAILALVFGIAGSVGGYFLNKEADGIRKVQEDTAEITDLNARISSLQKAAAEISSNVERASLPVLTARVKDFIAQQPPEPYMYDGYNADIQSLLDFAIEYLGLTRDKNTQISTVDSVTFFHDLDEAADEASKRATAGLRDEKIKNVNNYNTHVSAPTNFKNLLGFLKRDQLAGLNDDQFHCYIAAFSNWKYHITHSPEDSPNTPACQKLLGLGPA